MHGQTNIKLVVICVVLLLFVLLYVLSMCKCVLYCHRVLTQLQLTNISYHIQSTVNSSLFWDVRRHRFVVVYRRFGTTYRSHIQGSNSLDCLTLEDKTAETSVTSYQPTPRNIPEGQRPQTHDGGRLKSCKCLCVCPSGVPNAGQYDKMTIQPTLCLASWLRVVAFNS